MDANRTVTRRKEFVPPSDTTLDEYAQLVCQQMGCDEFEIVNGFATFLRTVAKLHAKQLTEAANPKE